MMNMMGQGMDVPVRLCTSDRGISPARDAQTSLETAHDKS